MLRTSALVGVILFVAGVLASPYLLVSNVASGDEFQTTTFDPGVPKVGGSVSLTLGGAKPAAPLSYNPLGFEVNASATFTTPLEGEDPLVGATVRLQLDPGLKEGQQVRLVPRASPAQNATIVYDPLLQGVHEAGRLAWVNYTQRLYSFLNGHTPQVMGWDDLPGGARVASPLPVPLAEEQYAPAFGSARPPPVALPHAVPANLTFGLVRDHTVLFYLPAGTHYPRVDVKDLNFATGPDSVRVTYKGLDGETLNTHYVYDDGNAKRDGAATTRPVYLPLTSQRGEWVVLEIRNTTSDIRIDDLILPSAPLFHRSLHLGGRPAYTRGELPLDVTFITRGGNVSATPGSNAGLGSLTLTREDGFERTLNLTARTKFQTYLEAGQYRAQLTNGSVLLQLQDGYFRLDGQTATWPATGFIREDAANRTLVVDTPLRGNHVFWTKTEDAKLRLRLVKQDLNTNNNDDNLTLTITGLNGAQVHRSVIPDDGNLTNRSIAGPLQTEIVELQGLPNGTYRIETKGSGDYRIREIEITPNKLVGQKLFPVGYNTCCFKTVPVDLPLDLYYAAPRAGTVAMETWHAQGFQDVRFVPASNPSRPTITATVAERLKQHQVNVAANETYRIHSPQQDIIFSGNGFFSFTPDSFFYPYKYDIVPYKANLTYLKERADFVLLDYGTYSPLTVVDAQGYYHYQRSWKAPELDTRDGKFLFTLQVTNYNKPGYENRTVLFRGLETELQYKPFWKGNGFLEWIHRTFG